ncbi:hypothetical protein PENSPDRAFT_659960 [Peniophora sp. CONT]|nr:hypothetical protein PENSPDRAFT_659960 [Peniophora sp. CONT]
MIRAHASRDWPSTTTTPAAAAATVVAVAAGAAVVVSRRGAGHSVAIIVPASAPHWSALVSRCAPPTRSPSLPPHRRAPGAFERCRLCQLTLRVLHHRTSSVR